MIEYDKTNIQINSASIDSQIKGKDSLIVTTERDKLLINSL